jgi:hypothetical protein
MGLTRAQKIEREFDRRRARLKKLTLDADVSFDAAGFVCLTYPNGQIFKCRGSLPESIFGHAPEVKK